MIRNIVENKFTDNKTYIEAYGKSTDAKPTSGIATGSTFFEVNTSKVFMFDESTSSWIEQG